MKSIHPFVYGQVVTALVSGVVAGVSALSVNAAGMSAALLSAGAIVSSVVCWWKPGFEAKWWLLLPVALLANPLMLVAIGFMVNDIECALGTRRGWSCIGFALAFLAGAASLAPPFGGLIWRQVRRRWPSKAVP
jgi:hypothetical protein